MLLSASAIHAESVKTSAQGSESDFAINAVPGSLTVSGRPPMKRQNSVSPEPAAEAAATDDDADGDDDAALMAQRAGKWTEAAGMNSKRQAEFDQRKPCSHGRRLRNDRTPKKYV
jgi:hypothetical protein